NAWRSTFGTALIAIAIPYMEWSTDRDFYIVAVLDGVVTAIGMILFFHLAAKRTGRVSSMILPMAAVGAYLTWWMISPLERPDLLQNPGKVLTATISAVIVFLALQKVRDNDASWESFLIVLPVGLAFGVIDALTKSVMGNTYNIYSSALAYAFIALAICAVAAWLAAMPKPAGGRPCSFFDRKLLWGAFWCAFWTAGMVLAGVFSLSLAPHPTLPGLVMALTPIWLFLLNLIRKVDDEVSLPASILIVVGAIGLLLSTI
ncbi:MAG TPA: hypothetical protein PKH37_08635, partial [Alphaproteobacteria bacterium]|nr:hypothetical protein [Alphaproteobacteria bacterium]